MKKWIHMINLGGFSQLPHLYSAGIQSAESVRYRASGVHWNGESHCIFQYTLSGHGMLSYYGTTYKIGPGEAFVIYKNSTDISYYYPPEATEPWDFVFCDICNFNDAIEQLNSRHGPVYNFGRDNFLAKKLIAMIERQQQDEAMISSSESCEFCSDILLEMCRIVEEKDRGGRASLAIKARNLIFSRRQETFSLSEIAEALGVCAEHLSREFKRQLNVSPKHYYDQLRIKSMYECLANTHKPIKEIAQQFSFQNISNFNTFFKKHTGKTPGQFRRDINQHYHDDSD